MKNLIDIIQEKELLDKQLRNIIEGNPIVINELAKYDLFIDDIQLIITTNNNIFIRTYSDGITLEFKAKVINNNLVFSNGVRYF